MQEPLIDAQYVARGMADSFDTGTLHRGQAYYRQGRVLSLTQSGPHTWTGFVRGRRSQPYETRVAFEPSEHHIQVDTGCSCPVGGTCKHVVATLLALEDRSVAEEQQAWDGGARTRAKPKANMNGAPADLAEAKQNTAGLAVALAAKLPPADDAAAWLAALERNLESPRAPEAAPESQTLAYWIGAYQDQPVLRSLNLELGRQRPRKAGGFASSRRHRGPIDNRYPMDPHRVVDAWLRVIYPPAYSWENVDQGNARFLEHPQMASLVRAMARTGRLYYGKDKDTPLRWSAPRTASLDWELRPDLQQHLGFGLGESCCAMVGEDAVYIDLATHEVGPLELNVPPAVAEAVSLAPPLSPEQGQAFRERLSERLQAFIPAPKTPRQRTQKVKAQPHLALSQQTAPDGSVQLQARVHFRYGDKLIDAMAPEDSAVYVEGDTVVTVPRQYQDEVEALRKLGLADIEETHGDESAPVLNLGDHLDDDGNVALGNARTTQDYAKTLESLTPLRRAGWSLQEGDSAPCEVVDVDAPVELTVQDGENNHWFDLRMGVEVDGEQVDLAPLLAAALERPDIGLLHSDWKALGPRVFLPLDDHRIIALPTPRLRTLLGAMRELLEARGLGLGQALELTHLLDTGDCVLKGSAFVIDLARRLRDCQLDANQSPPAGLQANLRPYQQHGLNWLGFLRANDLAGVLADDMGLGKTLQTIAHLLSVQESGTAEGPFLVVVPTSLLFNWSAELERFAPSLQAQVHHGSKRQLMPLEPGEVLLTSYGVMQRDLEELAGIHFDTVVLDEAHVIKNPRAKLHHAVRALQAKHRLCLTGTPLQNNLEELWAQFAFLMPGLLNTHGHFSKNFRTPIEKFQDETVRTQLTARIRPFMLRRQKAEVATELPPKTEMVERLEVTGGQRDLYETVRNLMDQRVRDALDKRGIAASSIVVLDALLKLRQVCCDPRLVKTDQAKRVKGSAKLERLLELVQELVAEGRRVLVFSQFTSMLELIGEALQAHDIAYNLLTGQILNRQQVVEDFQNGTAPVFLLSLKAGGVGLNLTAADTVIHYDPWWNPSAENQATDRAYRIGQDKPVFVYKLIVAGSLEERILELQQRKLQLSKSLVDDGAVSQQLTQGDLDRLFAPLE